MDDLQFPQEWKEHFMLYDMLGNSGYLLIKKFDKKRI